MTSKDLMPDSALIYLLMSRGSVLPKTMKQCIKQVQQGFDIKDEHLADEAVFLLMDLWSKNDRHQAE